MESAPGEFRSSKNEHQRHLRPKAVRWPDFFIVGAQNSATTTLYAYLRRHPQVFMPPMKEPHYFSHLRPVAHMRYPISYVADRPSYLRLFSRAGDHVAVGEASSSYLWETASAQRIYEANPQATIIIMLRDPVARAYSHYLMDVREGWASAPFYEALRRDWDSSEKGYGLSRLYVELGLYCNQVAAYLEIFGSKAVHIVLFEEFIAGLLRGDSRILAGIVKFLGLPCDDLRLCESASMRTAQNGYAEARFEWTRRIAGSRLARRLGGAIVPRGIGSTFALKQHVYDPLFLKAAQKPSMDARAKLWLCNIFEDDLASLEPLLGRKLTIWRRSW